MVGNWPHSILTLPRTAVTKVLILPLAKVSQIARALHLYIFKSWWTFSSLICVGNVLSNLVNFSTNVSNIPSVWRRGGWAIKCWWRTRVRRRRGNRDDGWWRGGWLGWQEGRYMRFHHWRPVRKTPILIRSHLSFFERCEKNNVGFPTTILIKASLENNVEMLRV